MPEDPGVEARQALGLRYAGDSMHRAGVQPPDAEALRHLEEAKRRNLAQAVRVVPELIPDIAAAMRELRDTVAPGHVIEGFVFNSGEVQACSFGGHGETLVMALSSGLVRLLTVQELMFVIGHELGHYLMGHHMYPVGASGDSEIEKLCFLGLQRAAEISADRVGYVACRSRDDALRAALKTASGLPDEFLRCDFAAYLDQSRELRNMGGSETEMLSTHPMFTARLRALLWFEMSEPYYTWRGRKGKPPLTAAELDRRVERDLAAAGGFRLAQAKEHAVRKALLWGILALFVADNKLSKTEQALLKTAFGETEADKAIGFVRDHGPKGVMSKFKRSLAGMRALSEQLRDDLYGDLERFASQAGGDGTSLEGVLIRSIDLLGLDREVNITYAGPQLDMASLKALRRR